MLEGKGSSSISLSRPRNPESRQVLLFPQVPQIPLSLVARRTAREAARAVDVHIQSSSSLTRVQLSRLLEPLESRRSPSLATALACTSAQFDLSLLFLSLFDALQGRL